MKRTRIIAGILLFSVQLLAETKQKLSIDEATVFLSGAELLSTASLNLAKGENEILFTNVAGNVNANSISVSTTNDVVVQSVTFQNNYLGEEVSTARIKSIKDSIEILNAGQVEINTKIGSIDESVAVLQANRKVGGENSGLSVAELAKRLDLIDSRWEAYLSRKNILEVQRKKIAERIAAMNRQINEEQQRGRQPGGQLLVKFYAGEAATTAVTITYVVSNAGWRPVYDINANGASGPVKLYYKANIFQNTGVKWTNVRLTLSTGNPGETAQAPVVRPWHIAFYSPDLPDVSITGYKVLLVNHDNKSSILATEQIGVLPTTQVTDMVSTSASTFQNQRGGALSLAGGRSDGTEYIIDGVGSQSTVSNHVAVDNTGVNTTFDINLPYTIPSDGQQHLVAIREHLLPASYRYFAAPRLDKDVFLQAQITKWEDLNLLPGETRIYHEGTYIGQGMLDVRNVKDTMNISLGRDKKIVVKREQDTKIHSRKVIGANEHETFAYTISVRNTRMEPVNLIVTDQVPLSTDKNIVVESGDNTDAEADEKTGLLTWTLSLAASETKTVSFGYSIKYPKGTTVAGLR